MVDAAAPHDALCPNKNIIHSAPSINAIGTSAHLGSAKDQVQTTAALMVGRSQTLYNIEGETKKSRAIYGIYAFLRVPCQEERRACWWFEHRARVLWLRRMLWLLRGNGFVQLWRFMRVRLFAGIATAIVSVFGCFLCVPKDLMFHFRFSNVTFEIISRLAYNICLYLTIKKKIY